MKPKFKCIEENCEHKVWHKGSRCHSCAEKHYWETHPEKKRQDKFCKICKRPISKRSKSGHCNSCAQKLMWKKNPHRYDRDNNPFFGKHHTKESIAKIIFNTIGDKNHNFLGGNSSEDYPKEFNRTIRNEIRKRDNYECQNCGMTEEEHLIVYGRNLHIHHIDYDKQNCKENNLISLCQGCNERANFNRDYWFNFYKQKILTILNK